MRQSYNNYGYVRNHRLNNDTNGKRTYYFVMLSVLHFLRSV